MRTSADYVSVGEELSCLFVVELFGGLFDEFPLFVQAAEKVGGGAAVGIGSCASVDIERNAEFGEAVLDYIMVAVHYVLRRYAFGRCRR